MLCLRGFLRDKEVTGLIVAAWFAVTTSREQAACYADLGPGVTSAFGAGRRLPDFGALPCLAGLPPCFAPLHLSLAHWFVHAVFLAW